MNLRIYDPTILAIDLRHRRFGYSVFRGHRALLDWGISIYRAVGDVEAAMVRKRLAGLLRLFTISAIVVKRERWERAQTSSHMKILVEAVTREASTRSIPISLIGQDDVEEAFHKLGCGTRDEIASVLARIFPELLWKVPPKRQLWQSEHPRMAMFDAIALGLTYWQHSSVKPQPPPE